jgi:hypothetical protein
MPVVAPIITHQPAAPSARAISSITRTASAAVSSPPPYCLGTQIENKPAAANLIASSGGSRRPDSISSPRDAISACSARARRVVRCASTLTA